MSKLRRWKGQKEIFNDRTHSDLAIIAGMGYGKSTAGARWKFSRDLINDKSPMSIVLAPDYKLAKQVCLEAYIETLQSFDLKEDKHYKINIADLTVTLLWGVRHKSIFLSAEKPKKLMAYTGSHGWIDEAARMSHEAIMNFAGRIRCPKAKLIQTLFTFVPEGENHMYEKFGPHKVERISDRHSANARALVLHGSSFDNKALPQSFFDNLKEALGWDEALWSNYVLGIFCSLGKHRFYYSFTQAENVKPCQLEKGNNQFVLTFDSNVGQMAWAVVQEQHHADKAKSVFVVPKANRANGRNYQEACQQFIDAFPPTTYGRYRIKVLGDATIHNRSPQTYTTGSQVIESCLKPHYPLMTFEIPRGNPFVAERSFCTNSMFKTGRLIIDPSCTKVIESAKMAESDGKGGIKKPSGDTVTHPMEAVDMALMVLCPPEVLIGSKGYHRLSNG